MVLILSAAKRICYAAILFIFATSLLFPSNPSPDGLAIGLLMYALLTCVNIIIAKRSLQSRVWVYILVIQILWIFSFWLPGGPTLAFYENLAQYGVNLNYSIPLTFITAIFIVTYFSGMICIGYWTLDFKKYTERINKNKFIVADLWELSDNAVSYNHPEIKYSVVPIARNLALATSAAFVIAGAIASLIRDQVI